MTKALSNRVNYFIFQLTASSVFLMFTLSRLHNAESAFIAQQHLTPIPFRHPSHLPKQTLPSMFPSTLFESNNNNNGDRHPSRAQSSEFASSVDNKNKQKTKSIIATTEFEMQELRAQLTEMAKLKLGSANLSLEKRQELEGYVKSICENSPSPIPLDTLAKTPSIIQGMWRLGFSTEKATLSLLPREATVYVNILTTPTRNKDGILEYILKFAFGALREIKATSTYTIDPGPVNPGLVTFIYQEITSGIFGMNLPVGLFGLLKGRANYIETVYFDGSVWFERGYSPEGEVYYNVFYRSDEGVDKNED
mmetsp:Transcript_4255/g.6295  ORF Transcript_4255/g.6295 Transcript_4255/m.6295 type:complete len:308 (+) Transcript_4255:86-1009(+)